MAENNTETFNALKPIPIGGSLTDAPKSWNWLNPPKLVKVDEVAQKYIDKLSSPEIINSALDVVETKVPLASMAEALMLSGVAVGVHTIDAGLLVMPVIIEMLKTIAEIHDVEYTIFPADPDDTQISSRVINSAIKKAMAKKETMPEETTKPVVELSGLMTRKPTTMENENGI